MYGTGASDYLERARLLIRSRKKENLFYAALELRNSFQSRVDLYKEVIESFGSDYDSYTRKACKYVQGWRLKDGAKHVRKVHREIHYTDDVVGIKYEIKGNEFLTYYTPITERLISHVDFLNALSHNVRIPDNQDDWFKEKFDKIFKIYKDLYLFCKGDNLLPPIEDPKNAVFEMNIATNHQEFMDFLGDLMKDKAASHPCNAEIFFPETPREWIEESKL